MCDFGPKHACIARQTNIARRPRLKSRTRAVLGWTLVLWPSPHPKLIPKIGEWVSPRVEQFEALPLGSGPLSLLSTIKSYFGEAGLDRLHETVLHASKQWSRWL